MKSKRIIGRTSPLWWAVACAVTASAAVTSAQVASEDDLFPAPFLVEHGIVQTHPDGSVFVTDPVQDHYGGSWIVSVRPDGSRLVVDFARREFTEIRPDWSTYSVLSFDRFADLKQRLQRAQGPPQDLKSGESEPEAEAGPPVLIITEVPVRQGMVDKAAGSDSGDELLDRPGVRRLRVSLEQETPDMTGPTLDVWFDPQIRLGTLALDALETLAEGLGATAGKENQASFAKMLSHARLHAEGALPFRTRRSISPEGEIEQMGSIEDVALRVEPLETFPEDLISVPEDFQRSVHPLEMMVSHAEEEVELRARMRGE